MTKAKPPHVGQVLREQYFVPQQLRVQSLARHLGVTRQALSRLLHEKSGISPDMAIRLGNAFSTSPDFWMAIETKYELWLAAQRDDNMVQPLKDAA